ncbi:hypothetical protein SAMN04489735_101651 [Aneurinibacillus thermoaerophilus]|uniref:Uncharacterized protein n=1 Tax=Aneurinibacillus thermoaerophilus TaxID=143495 RepID=A0A1G8AKG6_ANETH|nr:hypothetical protein SAMN04489735_101651 [Aneurinibacillus thermoaerophilus]
MRQIVEFTRGLIDGGEEIEPFNCEGSKPTLTQAANERELVAQIAERLQMLQVAGYKDDRCYLQNGAGNPGGVRDVAKRLTASSYRKRDQHILRQVYLSFLLISLKELNSMQSSSTTARKHSMGEILSASFFIPFVPGRCMNCTFISLAR